MSEATTYQLMLVDPNTNVLVAWDYVEATSRDAALAQRPKDWPARSTRASSQPRHWVR